MNWLFAFVVLVAVGMTISNAYLLSRVRELEAELRRRPRPPLTNELLGQAVDRLRGRKDDDPRRPW